ncbi:hypothetical protein [Streptomyces rochei]|uniref:Secreted protein n=1 Tax=Streptomyces rochei TaxID=1928 RepID=A0ABW7DTH0_STRRO
MLLVLGPGLLGPTFGDDSLVLAVVAQVRVGLAWGVPPGGLGSLPLFVGEPGAAAGVHGTAGLPLGPVLRSDAFLDGLGVEYRTIDV